MITGRVLIVAAVPVECDAIRAGLGSTVGVDVIAAGVGPAAAGASAARALALAEGAGSPYRSVISAGLGGGFVGQVEVGALVLATESIAADLGADSPSGFLPLEELGFGTGRLPTHPALTRTLAVALAHARLGPVLTLSTVTGTAEGTTTLRSRHPEAIAEAMEGFGVAYAALGAGVPFAELRAISNPVGPRERGSWRMAEAFATLTGAFTALAPVFASSVDATVGQ